MSTRCQIGFYSSKDEALTNITGWEALLYRHHDGYPSEAYNAALQGLIPTSKLVAQAEAAEAQMEIQAA